MTSVTAELNCQGKLYKCHQQQCIHLKKKMGFLPQKAALCKNTRKVKHQLIDGTLKFVMFQNVSP